jgi:uncharacterized C2H2 Zn-finger protein
MIGHVVSEETKEKISITNLQKGSKYGFTYKDRNEYSRKYNKTVLYPNNKENILKRAKEIRDADPERFKEYTKQWVLSASGVFYELTKRAKKRNNPELININKEDFIAWYNSQEQKCFYCGRNLIEIQNDKTQLRGKTRRFSIDRIESNKGYEIGNMVLACSRCNSIKNNFFTKDEMLKIVKMFPYKFK